MGEIIKGTKQLKCYLLKRTLIQTWDKLPQTKNFYPTLSCFT